MTSCANEELFQALLITEKRYALFLMDHFLDDFVENYFQWSELDEEDAEIKDRRGNSNVQPLGDREVNEGTQTDSREGIVKTEQGGQASRSMSKTEGKSSGDKYVNSNGKLVDESNMDGRESSTLSGQDDVEYHIKHCECYIHV